jgi:hypothetical protein
VLESPAVAAVIVGVRPGHSEHAADNKRAFEFALTVADHAQVRPRRSSSCDVVGQQHPKEPRFV